MADDYSIDDASKLKAFIAREIAGDQSMTSNHDQFASMAGTNPFLYLQF
jgi:hypothetical protein